MLECAAVPRYFQTAIKGVQRGVQIIKKNKAHKRESEITAALRQSALQFGSIHETGDIVKHGGAEEGLDRFQEEYGAIGARNREGAPEEKPQLAKDAHHSAAPLSGASAPRAVRRRKTSSREEAPVLNMSVEGVSQASRRPASITATRSARSSTSGRVWEAKSSEVPPLRRISIFSRRRNSAAAMTSRLRVGSSSNRTLG